MGDHGDLLQRVRDALRVTPAVREVNMFGGRAFMVNEKMLVSVGRDGDLLVRIDPERSDELLAIPGARQAVMGAGRSMGKGWVTVEEQAVATDEALGFWISVAAGYNDKATGWGSSRRPTPTCRRGWSRSPTAKPSTSPARQRVARSPSPNSPTPHPHRPPTGATSISLTSTSATMTDLELGFSARNAAEWDRIQTAAGAFPGVQVTAEDFRRAGQVQRLLAVAALKGRTVPDLLIAAAAERERLAVLHYDRDFERIAQLTGQGQQWIVPPGTVD